MNPEIKVSFSDKSRLFVREEKLKKSQIYKKKNQDHPAFKRKK